MVDVGWTDGVANLGGIQDAVAPTQTPRLDGGEDRQGGHLVVEDVAVLVQDDLVSALGMRHETHLVPLGSGCHEECRLFPEPLGGQRLEPGNCGILHEHIVADLGFGHRPPHGRGRSRHRITTEVNDLAGTRCRHDPLLFVP